MTVQKARNIIYTGVAGTGKTYRLQQLAEQYTQTLEPINQLLLLETFLEPLTWRDVVCLIFFQQKELGSELLTVAEISNHEFFSTKAKLNKRHSDFKKIVRELLIKFSDSSLHADVANSHVFFIKKDNCWCLQEDVESIESALIDELKDYQRTCLNKNNYDDSLIVNSAHTSTMKRYAFVSFHQSYGYDEFVEGIRPQIDEKSGQMRYAITDGIFLTLCKRAQRDPHNRYAIFIDEINRANVVQVFGELMTLIEPSKRLGADSELTVALAYSGRNFGVPKNIDIFATMNTQDYSLVSLDVAFRRRFEFVELLPDVNMLDDITDIKGDTISLSRVLTGLNKRICQCLGSQYQLGHSYFLGVNNIEQLICVMVKQVLPQLLIHSQHQPQTLITILKLTDAHSEKWIVEENDLYQKDTIINNDNELANGYFQQQNHHKKYLINPQLITIIDIISDNIYQKITTNDLLEDNNEQKVFFTAQFFIRLY